MKRQKRRWTWNKNHLRKHRFSFKGIGWKAEWYWDRKYLCLEDHDKRRTLEKVALSKIKKGYVEEFQYFPSKWRHRPDYFW